MMTGIMSCGASVLLTEYLVEEGEGEKEFIVYLFNQLNRLWIRKTVYVLYSVIPSMLFYLLAINFSTLSYDFLLQMKILAGAAIVGLIAAYLRNGIDCCEIADLIRQDSCLKRHLSKMPEFNHSFRSYVNRVSRKI